MKELRKEAKVISIGCPIIEENEISELIDHEHFTSFRAIKKQFRHSNPALIVLCISNENDEKLGIQTTQFIREDLLNQDSRIAVLYDPNFILDELNWMGKLQVNGCLQSVENKRAFNLAIFNREIDTFEHINNNRKQHEAETEMLMCISQLSRNKESISELLKIFTASLSSLCYSICSFHIKIESNDKGVIDYCDSENNNIVNDLNTLFDLPEMPQFLKVSFDEKKPQINLLTDDKNLHIVEKNLEQKIGSYLAFPIISYNKSLYLLIYLIPDDHMDKVTMKQINIINKASEQLTMLLERRQAENSLKKQYTRLKTALIDLKTAKKELQHKEKMASIGKMAAGIAHEINNPLAYVMSNFTCMDDYLNSIMKLQGLQAEFLKSIDMGENNKTIELKSHISKFEEKEDMAFVLQDIRAVISDSHNGLKRVKNIISDLKSFTHNSSTDIEICDFTKVLGDTLKILSYDLSNDITIEKDLSELPVFMAHNGLMQQALTNLIRNANQALIEDKTPNARILIKTECVHNEIHIKIQDNGPGIPNDSKEKIFEPFYTTKSVGEGTGMGLSVTFNIIKKLGGTISVKSEVNHYTEFTLSFPVSL